MQCYWFNLTTGGYETKAVQLIPSVSLFRTPFSFSLFLLLSLQSKSGVGLYRTNRGVGQTAGSDLETDRDIEKSLTGAGKPRQEDKDLNMSSMLYIQLETDIYIYLNNYNYTLQSHEHTPYLKVCRHILITRLYSRKSSVTSFNVALSQDSTSLQSLLQNELTCLIRYKLQKLDEAHFKWLEKGNHYLISLNSITLYSNALTVGPTTLNEVLWDDLERPLPTPDY